MGKEEVFDYYYGTEAEQFSFFRIPRVLIQDSRFKQVSTDAKLLYGLMLDRMSLSMKNGWLDEENRVYIIYTLENIMEDLNCGKDKGVKILAELDTVKGIGLIERKKRGLGKPSIIFVKNFASLVVEKKTEAEKEEDSIKIVNEIQSSEEPKSEKLSVRSLEFGKTEVLPSEKQQSGVLENGSLDFGKIEGNYNKDFNYNEFSYTDRNHNNPINLSEVDGIDCYMELIKENIEYDYYKKHGNIGESELVEELYQLICDVVCVKRKFITIGGDKIPYELVKSKFLKIKQPHIEYILESMKKVSSQIHNIRAYLLTTLYYAPSTMNYYYQQEVQKDMYGNG